MRVLDIRTVIASTAIAVLAAFVPTAIAGPVGVPRLPLGCDYAGCMPTPADCAKGAAPVTLGEHIGALTVCVAVAGNPVAYAGGNPLFACGTVAVADHAVVPGDANACDKYADDPLDLHVYTPTHGSTRGLPSLYLLTGSGGTWSDWQTYGLRWTRWWPRMPSPQRLSRRSAFQRPRGTPQTGPWPPPVAPAGRQPPLRVRCSSR